MRNQFYDYAGVLKDAPAVSQIIVAIFDDGMIVWSCNTARARHFVRYGLQEKSFNTSTEAASEFGRCVHHWAECDGKLDRNGATE